MIGQVRYSPQSQRIPASSLALEPIPWSRSRQTSLTWNHQGITVSQTQNQTRSRGGCAPRIRAVALVMLASLCACQLVLIAGCHRGFYRRQADAEARRLITEKAGERWNSATGGIEIDPMSRMFDPFSADHPPIPPDDPAAHKFMHEVDHKPGYPHWHANGNIDSVENPTWRSYLPTDEEGKVVLSLSLIHI